jgi:hypothetical protein
MFVWDGPWDVFPITALPAKATKWVTHSPAQPNAIANQKTVASRHPSRRLSSNNVTEHTALNHACLTHLEQPPKYLAKQWLINISKLLIIASSMPKFLICQQTMFDEKFSRCQIDNSYLISASDSFRASKG